MAGKAAAGSTRREVTPMVLRSVLLYLGATAATLVTAGCPPFGHSL